MNTDPPVFQDFKSNDSKQLESLLSRLSEEHGDRCILWSDIQCAFKGIGSLKHSRGGRVLFVVDRDTLVRSTRYPFLTCLRQNFSSHRNACPLMMNARRQKPCVERSWDDYYVVLSHEQEDKVKSHQVQLTMDQTLTTTAEQHIKTEQGHVPDLQLAQTALHLDHLLRSSKILSTDLQSSAANLNRRQFQQLAANTWYRLSKTLEELERLKGLGIRVQVDGMTKEQLCANVYH